MKNFAVHYQTWKNDTALMHVLKKFREYFPDNNIRVVSDCGNDYSHLTDEYDFDFEYYNTNTMPKGKMSGISGCYEWLYRVNETCLKYDTDWIVIFEDDVITQNSEIIFPEEDCGGFIVWPWSPALTNVLMKNNTKNKNWGYGMSGGSIFKREAFINSYIRIDSFDLYYLSSLDSRIITHSDTLINCFLQFFGYSYQIWEGMTDMTYPDIEVSKNACFVHGYKELY